MKITWNKLLFPFIIGLIISVSTFGQEVRKVALEECIQIGLQNSKTLHSSKQNVIFSNAKLSELNTARLPSLKFGVLYTRLSKVNPYTLHTPFGSFELNPTVVNQYNLKLTLQQPIFTGFKLSSSINMAEYNYKATKAEYTKDEKELIFKIKEAYWSLFKSVKFKEFIDENVAQVKAHLEDVQNFFKQGLATKNEVLKVQVQLAQAQLRQIDAENAVKMANINLDNTINLPLSTKLEIQKNISVESKDLSGLDALIEKAISNRPEIKAMNYRIKAGESGVTFAKSDWFPQIYLAGSYNYSRPNPRIFPTQDEFKGTWDVSLSLSFDLWNWGSTIDKTSQAEAQLEQAKDGYKILKDGITLEVTQNYLALNMAKEKMSVAEYNVSQAEENYRVTDEKFKNGLALNSELLDAEVALLQAKTENIQSRVDYELAKAKLEKSTGDR